MTLGDRIRKRREQLGMSQRELARRTKIPQPVLSNLERGIQADVTTALAKRLAQALACTTDYLIGMYEEEETEAVPPALVEVGA